VARFVFNCIKWCMQSWFFITVIFFHAFDLVHLQHPCLCNLSFSFPYLRSSATKFPSWMDTALGATRPNSFQNCSSIGKVMEDLSLMIISLAHMNWLLKT